MTNGLKRNVARLFGNDGKLFLMAMDHAQSGLMDGLGDIRGLLCDRAETAVDGFLINVGLAPKMAEGALLHKKLALRTSFGGSRLSSSFTNVHRNHVSPETALALGADAVVMMMVMGGADYASIQDAAADIDAFHQYGIPVIVEILADDFTKTQTYEIQANGARVAAELGADVVKAFYTENFAEVVASCPAPIILAGGPKGQSITDVARDAVRCGVKGFAFGRNLFQGEGARESIRVFSEILHG